MSNQTDASIHPKFVVVRLDETEHWAESVRARVKKIWSHYIYDEHMVTHICSLQGSYYLRRVGFDIELADTEAQISEELFDVVVAGFAESDRDSYHDCGPFDRMELDDDRKKVLTEGTEVDEIPSWSKADPDPYEEAFEDIVDHYLGNPAW